LTVPVTATDVYFPYFKSAMNLIACSVAGLRDKLDDFLVISGERQTRSSRNPASVGSPLVMFGAKLPGLLARLAAATSSDTFRIRLTVGWSAQID